MYVSASKWNLFNLNYFEEYTLIHHFGKNSPLLLSEAATNPDSPPEYMATAVSPKVSPDLDVDPIVNNGAPISP